MRNALREKVVCVEEVENSFAAARSLSKLFPDAELFVLQNKMIAHAKGKGERVWNVFPGQLLVTGVLKIEDPYLSDRIDPLYFSKALFIALYKVLRRYGALFKWPNDFYLNDKKIGGVLFELDWNGSVLENIIFGYGFNLNVAFPLLTSFPGLNPTSLLEAHKMIVNKDRFLMDTLREIKELFGLILFDFSSRQIIDDLWDEVTIGKKNQAEKKLIYP